MSSDRGQQVRHYNSGLTLNRFQSTLSDKIHRIYATKSGFQNKNFGEYLLILFHNFSFILFRKFFIPAQSIVLLKTVVHVHTVLVMNRVLLRDPLSPEFPAVHCPVFLQ